jgi:hypothetical protein
MRINKKQIKELVDVLKYVEETLRYGAPRKLAGV